VYSYQDTGGSTACVDTGSACVIGSTVAQGTAYSTNWGAGIGINVSQTALGSTPASVTPTASGLTYSVSSIPTQGLRVVIGNSGADVCHNITTTSGQIPWSDFVTDCWDTVPDGGVYSTSDGIIKVQFQVPAGGTPGSYEFCVNSVSF
jgi:hypothetical protein